MDVLIVGAGEMGRWFADTLETDVAFADVDESAAQAAADAVGREVGRRARVVGLDDAEHFGAVCIAVPMSAAVEAIETHAPKAQQAVVDVTGAMAAPLEAMARAAPSRERMSLHPLFAAANAPGNVAVAYGAPGPATDHIKARLTRAGNALVETTADEHDEAMRTVQGRAHAAILAFALTADDVPEGFETPVYEALQDLVGQVTGGTARVYADIQATFGGAAEIAEAADALTAADAATFAERYREAGRPDWPGRTDDAGQADDVE